MSASQSKLTPDLIATLALAAERLLPLNRIASLVGVHRSSVYRWLKAGGKEQARRENGRPADDSLDLHAELFVTWQQAEAKAMQQAVKNIQAAADSGVWQASAWLLERRWPSEWSNDRKELNVLRRKLAELEKMLGDREQPASRAGG